MNTIRETEPDKWAFWDRYGKYWEEGFSSEADARQALDDYEYAMSLLREMLHNDF